MTSSPTCRRKDCGLSSKDTEISYVKTQHSPKLSASPENEGIHDILTSLANDAKQRIPWDPLILYMKGRSFNLFALARLNHAYDARPPCKAR